MGIANTKQAVFIVWIPQELLVEYIPFKKDHWEKVKTNLEVFFKIYVRPALLCLKPFVPNVIKYWWRKVKLMCRNKMT